MKKPLSLISCGLLTSLYAFAGEMGPVSISVERPLTYVAIAGGDYSSLYQPNYIETINGVTTTRESFNDTNNNGFGQIAIGTESHIGTFRFDQQVVATILGGNLKFNTTSSIYKFRQKVDFGYDIMPKFNFTPIQNLDAYGILGVHSGYFIYQKSSSVATATTFDVSRNQIGFNLGVGLSYAINNNLALGVKYQHWQYGTAEVFGTNSLATKTEAEYIPASFNLVGLELRYFIN